MGQARVVVYGATGFTGRLILARMMAADLAPVLVGRDAMKLRALAEPRGLPWQVATLDDDAALDRAFADARLVLNAAGPFATTALPIAQAAARQRAHYLDVSGEIDAIESLAAQHSTWARDGVMVLPAVGFDVVPSDCLAVLVAREHPRAQTLRIGIAGLYLLSRGSAATLAREWGKDTRVRRAGSVVRVPPGTLEHPFDFGHGSSPSVLVSWGDVATAYYSTGIPNIETYFEANAPLRAAIGANRLVGSLLGTPLAQAAIERWHALIPEGPSNVARERVTTTIVAEVEEPDGRRFSARVDAGDSYGFTAEAATVVVRRVLAGDVVPGFQTPGRAYGPELLRDLPTSPISRIAL